MVLLFIGTRTGAEPGFSWQDRLITKCNLFDCKIAQSSQDNLLSLYSIGLIMDTCSPDKPIYKPVGHMSGEEGKNGVDNVFLYSLLVPTKNVCKIQDELYLARIKCQKHHTSFWVERICLAFNFTFKKGYLPLYLVRDKKKYPGSIRKIVNLPLFYCCINVKMTNKSDCLILLWLRQFAYTYLWNVLFHCLTIFYTLGCCCLSTARASCLLLLSLSVFVSIFICILLYEPNLGVERNAY